MRVTIEGFDLPGRTCCDPGGAPFNDVRVGLQVRKDPEGLVPGDALSARWDLDVTVVGGPDGDVDFRGPAVHGKRGDRFLYLTWGNVTDGAFEMFRRAKLMLNRIDRDVIAAAGAEDKALVARVRLTDERGGPRCARVDPPDLEWTVR